jgi:hypothetical protein
MMGGGPPPPGSLPPSQPGGAPGAAPLPTPAPPGGKSPSGGQNPILLLLSFLAGAGLDKVIGNVMKLIKPPGQGPKSGARMDASKAPAQTMTPQMMQQLQGQGQPGQPGGPPDPKLMMLIQQLLGNKGGMQ